MATNRKTKTTTGQTSKAAAGGFAAKATPSPEAKTNGKAASAKEPTKADAATDPEVVAPEVKASEVKAPEAKNPDVKTPEPKTASPAAAPKAPAKAAAKKTPAPQENLSISIRNRPIMATELEFAGTIVSAGERPVGASHMEVFGTILNGRPIEASQLVVADMTGSSPIFATSFKAVEGLDLPGGRPVMASDPGLLSATYLPGGRPIASNEIDDSEALMGFLD